MGHGVPAAVARSPPRLCSGGNRNGDGDDAYRRRNDGSQYQIDSDLWLLKIQNRSIWASGNENSLFVEKFSLIRV
jgi:hypothetical protein